jgi:hypothetical protein
LLTIEKLGSSASIDPGLPPVRSHRCQAGNAMIIRRTNPKS